METAVEHPIPQVANRTIERSALPVCVLDDDNEQVEMTVGRLEKAGFPVVGTTDPQEALG